MSKMKLIITDCDGVLTPMNTFYSEEGRLYKIFSSHDSYAIKKLRGKGFDILIMTADKYGLKITERRGLDWGITVIFSKDKLASLKDIKKHNNYEQIYFIGNGPEDIVVLNEVDLFFAPEDSRPEVKGQEKVIILPIKGGDGVLDKCYEYIENEQDNKQ